MKKPLLLASFLFCIFFTYAQTPQDFINTVDLQLMKKTIDELSGEVPTKVGGSTVTIRNRVSKKGNDVAAEYLKEKLTAYHLTAVDQNYSSQGRNVYAVQRGKTKPDQIYIICGHYDAMADYCADDNLSGTVTVLEAARILSQYCFESTIVYALWDQEEEGLYGAKYYAADVKAKNQNILGVLNMDMNAYDGDKDKNFDIDLNTHKNSIAMKDLLLSLVKTYKLDLIPNVITPGTLDSDHAAFWPTYGAVLLGECWSKNDITPFYHKSTDRANTLNWSYYYEMVKLAVAYISTAAVPIVQPVDVSQNGSVLTCNTVGTCYQWVDCNRLNAPIVGQTGKTFTATYNGDYAVIVTVNGCANMSGPFKVTTLGIGNNNKFQNKINLFPNPSAGDFLIDFGKQYAQAKIEITDITGNLVFATNVANEAIVPIHFKAAPGVYFVSIHADGEQGVLKLVVDQQ